MARSRAPRNTLTRDRIVAGALELADRDGLDALTIRALAAHLGVRPMAIYHHVPNKDAIIDALVDAVHGEVEETEAGEGWRDRLADRSRSLRSALRRHPWAVSVIDARPNPGPNTLRTHEAALDILRTAGFSLAATAHAYAILDAFVYGFVLQEVMLESVGLEDATDDLIEGIDLAGHPRMAEFAVEHVSRPGYSFADSFEVGLDILLDGIEELRPGVD